MKKSLIFSLLLFILSFAGCLIEDDAGEKTGTLKIRVITTSDIWGYPTAAATYNGAPDALFHYPYVGGNKTLASLPGNGVDANYYYPNTILAADVQNEAPNTAFSNVGTRENYVYVFSSLAQKSDDNPVLYHGSSDTNNSVITIDDIEAGTYYVVAFYDYRAGGNTENIFNRYDRYAIYAYSADAEAGTFNSTPYFDKAAPVTITFNQTTEIILQINDKNWVLGKPKATDKVPEPDVIYEMGRYFLRTGDYAPVP